MPTELRDGVWWFDLGIVNAYLVDDDGVLTLIDAGPPWRSGAVLQGLVDAGYALVDLDRVLITHYDADHVGALSRLDGLDVEVYAGAGDAPLVTGELRPQWDTRKGFSQRLMASLVSAPNAPVHPVTDGDQVGGFTVYETPGHTDGHVAFVHEGLGAAFVGDLVRESTGDLALSPWYITADTDEAAASVHSFAQRAPPFEVLATGHGVPFLRDGKRRLDALADGLDAAENDQIDDRQTLID